MNLRIYNDCQEQGRRWVMRERDLDGWTNGSYWSKEQVSEDIHTNRADEVQDKGVG